MDAQLARDPAAPAQLFDWTPLRVIDIRNGLPYRNRSRYGF